MRYRPSWFYTQSAVVPYRRVPGAVEVLLITSRSGKRWTIPKGVVERRMSAPASAAKEAFEEAGVRGEVDGAPLGVYEYEKWGGTCRVEVFPMLVRDVLDEWPEARERERRWLRLADAVDALASEDVRRLVLALEARLGAGEEPAE